ncbi:response regulator transcription factor [Propionibacteriaceae bacterium Y2011]
MATLLLFTPGPETSADVLPALGLLDHHVRVVPADAAAVSRAPVADLWLLDARRDLVAARALCRNLTAAAPVPVLLVVAPDGLPVLSEAWGFDDFVPTAVGPAELQTRIRLLLAAGRDGEVVTTAGLVIDEGAYAARLHGDPLDLTYTEFELLKFLAQHPGRVFSRQQLLSDVWGYDYYGGTRTVDVHVRRLRAKLGPEHESLIQTVRNVGYRLVPPASDSAPSSGSAD